MPDQTDTTGGDAQPAAAALAALAATAAAPDREDPDISGDNGDDGDDGEPASEPPTVIAASLSSSRRAVDVRNVSLIVLAILAGIYTLHWAAAVFIPLLLGLMLSYSLTPLVNQLQRWRLPRALGAALLMLGLCGGAGAIVYSLSDDASSLIESLPEAAQKLRQALSKPRQAAPSAIEKVQKAATELERVADETSATPKEKRGVTRVSIERPRFDITNYLWSGTLGLVTLAGQAVMVVLIAYFLLASGTTFRRKMVKLAGPTLSQKRVTVQALDEISEQIQRYLLVQLFTSAIVGVATGIAFLWIGLEHAAVWAVVAAVTNLVPYLGAAIVGGGSALVAFMQFGTLDMALLVGGASFAIHSVVGYLLLPWMTSRASRLNPVAVFVGVLAWGWLWGLWGLLLGVPILMVVKASCDRVEDLKPVGELLGS
ncbi:MAG: AI-2E family transporter [Burkholderiaceae bacterium]